MKLFFLFLFKGTKHIDPDTGLIYFKYDFGYEFGLVLPGQPQKVDKIESTIGKEGTIELPVIHEHTTPGPSPTPTASAPAAKQQESQQSIKAPVTFKPKKFTTSHKVAKWEPTDSELSDQESIGGGGASSSRYYGERKQTFKSNSGNKLTAGGSGSRHSTAEESASSISPSPEPNNATATAGRKQL